MFNGSRPIRSDKIHISGGVTPRGTPNPVQYEVDVFDPSGIDNDAIFRGTLPQAEMQPNRGDAAPNTSFPQANHTPQDTPSSAPEPGHGAGSSGTE